MAMNLKDKHKEQGEPFFKQTMHFRYAVYATKQLWKIIVFVVVLNNGVGILIKVNRGKSVLI